MNKQEIKNKVQKLINQRDEIEKSIHSIIKSYVIETHLNYPLDSIPIKKIIREELELVA